MKPQCFRLSRCAVPVLLSMLLTGAAMAQTSQQHSPSTSPRVKAPGDVAISPDGMTVAWTLRGHDDVVHLSPAAAPEQDKTIGPEGQCAVADLAWSPNSQTLAFLGSCVPPSSDPTVPRQEQVYLWSKSTGDIRQLTHLKGELDQIAWSPDGKTIAFLFVENATRSAGALDAMKPWSGVIGEDNIEVQRVYDVDLGTGLGNWITPANRHVYEFSWAPNSHEIAFIGANPPGENNWWVARLYTADFTRNIAQKNSDTSDHVNEELRTVFDPNTTTTAMHGLQIAVPRWSPDGRRIAFIGGLMSDQGSTGGDIWVVDAKQNAHPVDITPNIDGTPTYEAWLNDNRIGFVEDRRGHILLPDYNVATRKEIPGSAVDLGEVSVGGGAIKNAVSFSHNGIFAFTESSFTHAPEVYIGRAETLKQFTHLNDGLKPLNKVESVQWTNEGFHVQGWLAFPVNYDPQKTYPLIVTVHGGPSASVGARWSSWGTSMWPQLGYFEFMPNPRGSFGQGEAFTLANRKDFGYGDLRDILKGLDTLEAKFPIDKTREGLTGWSYGGYMTMFAVTQTHRFRAAVAGAGISDWRSYYGENSIDQWMIPFFGASVYDNPAVYAKSSPITFIKNVETPTLVLVGDRDGECPAPQSFEFWHALRDLGVTTQLVVYPDEGHGFRDPAHIRDRAEREAAWFAQYMPAK